MKKKKTPGSKSEIAKQENQNMLKRQNQRPDREVVIYTDGGATYHKHEKPWLGGWAAVVLYKKHRLVIYGGMNNVTANRMEMKAAIEALKGINKPVPITLYTDSQYLQKGATIWSKNWVKKGILGKKKNPDLWVEIIALNRMFDVDWKWIPGHKGFKYNEIADKYATKGMRLATDGDFGTRVENLNLQHVSGSP